jgi:hypothetical protein
VASELLKQTVPLSRLMSAEPQTFTITGSTRQTAGSTRQTADITGKRASIDYNWTMTITIPRMG